MGQMASTSWIATTNGAFLEVAFQDVAPREGVTAKYTHVRSISSVCSKLDLINPWGNYQAYVEADGALNVLRVSKSWCSEDKGIFHQHLWRVSKRSCQFPDLSAILPDVPGRSVRYLFGLESQQRELVVPYLAFVRACCFGHKVASLLACAAIRSLASAARSEASAELELEQSVEDETWLSKIEASWARKFGSLGSAADSCCQASSDRFVAVLQAVGNCPCYWQILEYSVLQASLVCEGRFHHKDFAWHAERPGAAVTYAVAGGPSLAEADEEKRLAVESTENCCWSSRFDGIENCP
jgi:hypothetical protein